MKIEYRVKSETKMIMKKKITYKTDWPIDQSRLALHLYDISLIIYELWLYHLVLKLNFRSVIRIIRNRLESACKLWLLQRDIIFNADSYESICE